MGRKHTKLLDSHGHIRNSLTGFSLVELMVAVAIAGFLGIGLWTLMTSQNKTYAAQDNTSQMQQNLRAAVDNISRDLLTVGQGPQWQMTMNGASTGTWYVAADPYTPYGVAVDNELDIIGCLPPAPGTDPTTLSAQATGGTTTQITVLPAGRGASFPVNTYVAIGDARSFESAIVRTRAGDNLTIDTNPGTAGNQPVVSTYRAGTGVYPLQWITYKVTGTVLTRDLVHDGTAPPVVASNITGLHTLALGGNSLTITLTGSTGPNGVQSAVTNTIHLRNQ